METSTRNGLMRWFMLSAVLLTCGIRLQGAENLDAEWESDLDYLVRLGQERFDFYAEMQRKLMTAKYSSRKDDLKLANAIYFFSVHKPREAEGYLRSFTQGHKLYTRALFIRGTKYAELGMFPDSAKNFKLYLQEIPEAPRKKRAKKEFVTALQYYTTVLQKLGRGNEAAALIDKMPPDDDMGERELAYLKQLSRIEAEENKLTEGKWIDTRVLNTASNELKKLFFVRDGISVLAAIQVGRIQGIIGNSQIKAAKGNKARIAKIGNFLDGIRTIKQFEDFIVEMEESNGKETSPMPEAMYYKAINIIGQAEVSAAAGKLELASKQLSKGAVRYFKMIQNRYAKSSFVHKLPLQYLRCEEVNAKWHLNAKLNLPKIDRSDMAALFKPGDLLLQDAERQKNNRAEALKRYNQAIERYKDVVNKNMANPDVAKHVGNYMRCLAMADRLDEGKALLEKLQKAFPDEKDSVGKAALMLGAFANKRMKEWPKGKVNPLKVKQENLYFWARNLFVDNAPSHPQAPLVAYDLAVTKFNEAVGVMKKAKDASPVQKKSLEAKGKKLIEAAIPYYQRVADLFPMHQKGKASLLKLAQMYNILNKLDIALDYYARYLKSDDGSLPKDTLLEAQYFLAELQYRSNRPREARENYEKVKAMTDPGKPYSRLPNTKMFREIALAFIPDALDRESDLLTNQLSALGERKSSLNNGVRDLESEIRAMTKGMTALQEQEKPLREATADAKNILSSFELDYKAAARKQAKADASKPGAQKTEQEFYTTYLEGKSQAAVTNVSTERSAIATQKKALAERRTALASQRQGLTSDIQMLQRGNATLKKSIEQQRQKVKRIKESFVAIDKKVRDSESRCQAYRKTLATSKDDTEIKKTKDALQAEEKTLADLRNEKIDTVNYGNQQAIVLAERDILLKQSAMGDNQWRMDSLRSELKLVAMREDVLASLEPVLQTREEFMDQVQKVIEGNEDARLKANAKVKARAQEINALLDATLKKELDSLASQRAHLSAQIKACEKRKVLLQADGKQVAKDMEPLESAWRKQKREAVRGYETYLNHYPQGKYFARCTTDLAAGLADLERYSEAVQRLNSLVDGRVLECYDSPGNTACDPDKTVHALFNLAKAQTKANMKIEASGTYKRLMESQHEGVKAAVQRMSLGNLFFIADQGLSVGSPQATLIACELILKRVAQGGTSVLRPAQIENVYVTAARASLECKDYAKCLAMGKALLELNPRSAYLYDIRELEAEALVSQGKINEGIGMLNQLIRRSRKVSLGNRFRCTAARLYLKSTNAKYRANALSMYESIITYAKDSVELTPGWLESKEAKENEPWIDEAFVGAAKLYRQNGDGAKLQKVKDLYAKLFPQGTKLAELSQIN